MNFLIDLFFKRYYSFFEVLALIIITIEMAHTGNWWLFLWYAPVTLVSAYIQASVVTNEG